MTEPSAPEQLRQQLQGEEKPPIGPFGRLIGVIFSPGETFADINRRPTWVVALIISILFSVGFSYLLQLRVPNFEQRLEELTRQQIQETLERRGQPVGPEAQEGIERQVALYKKFFKFSPLLSIVFVPLGLVLTAGAFFLVLLMVQAEATFKKTFSVLTWSWTGTFSVPQTLVSAVVLMLKDPNSIDLRNPESIVATSLGAMLSLSPKTTNALLYSLATSIDIFTIWFLILAAIGLSAISRKVSRTKAGVIVFVLWALWVAIKAGWTMLATGRVG